MTPDLLEKARELVRKIESHLQHDGPCSINMVVKVLEETDRASDRKAREECAEIAAAHEHHGEFWHGGRDDCVYEITKEIRAALAGEPPKKEV